MEEPKNIQETLNWLAENIGLLPTVIVVIIALCCIIWQYFRKQGGKENIEVNQNFNTGGIQAGQINAPVTQYNIQKPNDIFSEYEARSRALVEKGNLGPHKLEWRPIRAGETKEIKFVNAVAPALVVHAYRSEPFKREFHGPELISYLIETVQNGYMKRMINGKYLPAAFTEGIWPYYLLTVQAKNGSLVEINPPKVVDMMNEEKKDDSMVAVEHMFQEVKEKAGDPFELRSI